MCSVHGGADESPTQASAQTGAITGMIVNLEGHSVAGAEVWGLAYHQKYGPTHSGADGRFRLSALLPGKPVTIWADASGLSRERREDVHIFPGRDRDIGRLVLLPGTRMLGRLIDAQGKPVPSAGVKVRLFRSEHGRTINSQGTEWTLTTGGDGRFATSPLPAGEASFSFSSLGKVRTFVTKFAEPGKPIVDLGNVALPDEMPVSGVVVDQDGKPAPKVEVAADYDWEDAATTDQKGRFALHGIGKDLKVLLLRSNDYFSPKPFNVTSGRLDLKITAIKAYEIHGSAVDAETGKPVPMETVQLCRVIRDPDDGHITLAG